MKLVEYEKRMLKMAHDRGLCWTCREFFICLTGRDTCEYLEDGGTAQAQELYLVNRGYSVAVSVCTLPEDEYSFMANGSSVILCANELKRIMALKR